MLSKNLLKAAIALSGASLSPFLFGTESERPGFWGKEYEAESKPIPQTETSGWEWDAATVEIFSADGGYRFEQKGISFRFSQISEFDEKTGLASEFSQNIGIGSSEWSELEQIRIPANLELGFRKTIDEGFSVYAGIFGGADILYWNQSERYLGVGLQIGVKFEAQYQLDESNAITFGIGFDRNIERLGTDEGIDSYTENKIYRIISIGYRRFF